MTQPDIDNIGQDLIRLRNRLIKDIEASYDDFIKRQALQSFLYSINCLLEKYNLETSENQKN